MATQAARAGRNREARQRLDAAFTALADRLGIEVPPDVRRMKDPGLQPIVEVERFADFAEAMLVALGVPDENGEIGATTTTTTTTTTTPAPDVPREDEIPGQQTMPVSEPYSALSKASQRRSGARSRS